MWTVSPQGRNFFGVMNSYPRAPAAWLMLFLGACAGSPAPPARQASGHGTPAPTDSATAPIIPLDTLLARLRGGPFDSRMDALVELARPGPRVDERIAALAEALRDSSQKLGLRAAWALGQMGAPAVPPLTRALTDRRAAVRMRALYALGAVGQPAAPAAPAVRFALTDPDQSVRDMASWTIGQLGPPTPQTGGPALGSSEDLAAGLAADASSDRAAALRRFFPYGADSRKAMPLLIRALGDTDPRVSQAAADALLRLGPPSSGPLAAALSDSNPEVRRRAAATLVRLRRAGL